MTTVAQRDQLARAMDYLVAHAGHGVTWDEVRPIPRAQSLAQLELIVTKEGLKTDCSGSSIVMFEAVGLKSPTGVYNGQGDTQTIYDHLPDHYTNPRGAMVGALCWFGIDNDLGAQHITVVRHPGKDPVLFSLGENPGPRLVPLSVERTFHAGTPTFLSIAHL